jgi:hypothetical protein
MFCHRNGRDGLVLAPKYAVERVLPQRVVLATRQRPVVQVLERDVDLLLGQVFVVLELSVLLVLHRDLELS